MMRLPILARGMRRGRSLDFPDRLEEILAPPPFPQELLGGVRRRIRVKVEDALHLAAFRRRLALPGLAAQQVDRGEKRRLDPQGAAGDGETFAAALEEEPADEGEADPGKAREQRFEQRDLALAQRLD